MEPELYGIIYKHDADDFEFWQVDLPDSAIREIEEILDRYRNRGCSVRGTRNDIKDEL